MAEALAKADATEQARKAAEAEAKAKLPKTEEAPDPTAMPWTAAEVQQGIQAGTKLTYRLTGKNAKGKSVDDTYLVEIKSTNETKGAGFTAYRQSEAGDPAVSQPQVRAWDRFSPVFPVERPEADVKGRETIETPAGSFETSVADVRGFFGERMTVWMIVDRPGVYAKVIEYGREEGDKTELVYELASIEAGG